MKDMTEDSNKLIRHPRKTLSIYTNKENEQNDDNVDDSNI